MTELKQPRSFDEQIEILKKRGLTIDNYEDAKFILSNVNYYRFTAYLLPFKCNDDTYFEGTSFKKIYSIYMFDREFRTLLVDVLGSIEILLLASTFGEISANNFTELFPFLLPKILIVYVQVYNYYLSY